MGYKMTFRALCLFLFFATSGITAANNAVETCSLTMGWEPWKPFQYLDDHAALTGFDIELIKAIVTDMNCELDFKQVNWARGIVEVRSGELDMLPHADFTEERSQWAYFSNAYRDVSQVLYVKPGTAKRYPFKNLTDIIDSEFRLGVGRGVFIGDKFEELMLNPEFKKHIIYIPTDEMQQYQMLHADRIDGYVRTTTAIDSLRDILHDELSLEIHPLPILTSKQHFLFSQQSVKSEFVNRFNASLEEIVKTGIYDELKTRFLK